MQTNKAPFATSCFVAAVAFCSCLFAAGPHPSLPRAGRIDGLGVNIHFTDPRPGELDMLAAGGFRWVRMDFAWGRTERESGRYDFSAYERLLEALQPHGIRALFILDYSNPLYEKDRSVVTEPGRKAFARWAAAAAEHFQGRGILWEIWNEPNIPGLWTDTATGCSTCRRSELACFRTGCWPGLGSCRTGTRTLRASATWRPHRNH